MIGQDLYVLLCGRVVANVVGDFVDVPPVPLYRGRVARRSLAKGLDSR
jgi:hypothetical protein